MADANELEDNEHKYLIIVNKSNANIILYIYSGWAPFCKVSTIPKIIEPNKSCLYHEKAPFKFKISAKLSNGKKEKLLEPKKCSEDKVITITESLECQANELENNDLPMADANELEDNEHKYLIIVNKSNANIILYIYSGWAPFCKVSTISKIIEPNKSCLYHEKAPFKFKISAKLSNGKKEKLLEPKKCSEDKVITITESLECQANELENNDLPMADANELEDNEHKYLIIVNKSNANIILYIYSGWAPFCKVSTISKIIEPNKSCLYHEKAPFKFKISAKLSNGKKEKLLEPKKCSEDKVITITESLECQANELENNDRDTQLCLRRRSEEELAHADLYDFLGLDMEKIRKMKNNEDMRKDINDADERPSFRVNGIVTYRSIFFCVGTKDNDTQCFHTIRLKWKTCYKQMQIWHPNNELGYSDIQEQIKTVKEILMDDAKRACHHNKVRYDKGWLLPKFKAVFWSDCYTKEQKKAYWRRAAMFAGSVLLAFGGIALSLGTAGAAAPVVVALGAVFGGGFTGAGCLSLGHTVSKKSIVEGCGVKAWLAKAGLGFLGGVVTGGAAAGITTGIVGIGSAALESGAVSVGQYVAMGSATGAVGGVVSSLTSDAAKVFVDKEKGVTAKRVFLNALFEGVIGAVAGALAGLVTKGVVDSRASAATPTLEGDAVEHVSALTGEKRIAHGVARAVSKQVTIKGANAVFGTVSKIVEERIDDSVENQRLATHVRDGVENLVVNTVTTAALYSLGAGMGHGVIEQAILDQESDSRNPATSKEPKAESYTNNNEAHENIQGSGNETTENQGAGEENNEQGNETNDDQEDDEPEEQEDNEPVEQEDDEPEEDMFKLSNVKGKKGMNMRKETGRPRNQSGSAVIESNAVCQYLVPGDVGETVSSLPLDATNVIVDGGACAGAPTLEGDAVEHLSALTEESGVGDDVAHPVLEQVTVAGIKHVLRIASKVVINTCFDDESSNANRNKCESGRSHITNENTTPKRDDQSFEGRSTQQNPHVVSEESRANQSSNAETYDENRRPKVFVDKKKDVTAKRGVLNALFEALAGFVTNGVVDSQASAATPTLEGDAVEHVSALTGEKRIAHGVARAVSKQVTIKGTKAVFGTVSKVVEERIDDSVENQPLATYVRDGVENLVVNTVTTAALYSLGAGMGHGIEEAILDQESYSRNPATSKEPKAESYTNNNEAHDDPERDDQSFEGRSTQQNPHVVSEESRANQSSNAETYEENRGPSDEISYEPHDATIKYQSKGYWFSKMIVSYKLNGQKIKPPKQVSGDGKRVHIPAAATNITVKFQVRRPFWGDIMKYDRFQRFPRWVKVDNRYITHTFHYDRPTNRTFTISGPLWWEAVMGVTDEHGEETYEMR